MLSAEPRARHRKAWPPLRKMAPLQPELHEHIRLS